MSSKCFVKRAEANAKNLFPCFKFLLKFAVVFILAFAPLIVVLFFIPHSVMGVSDVANQYGGYDTTDLGRLLVSGIVGTITYLIWMVLVIEPLIYCFTGGAD